MLANDVSFECDPVAVLFEAQSVLRQVAGVTEGIHQFVVTVQAPTNASLTQIKQRNNSCAAATPVPKCTLLLRAMPEQRRFSRVHARVRENELSVAAVLPAQRHCIRVHHRSRQRMRRLHLGPPPPATPTAAVRARSITRHAWRFTGNQKLRRTSC